MERLRCCFRCTFLLCLLSASLLSQDFRGSITGQVIDSSGGAIPNAAVKVTNSETNASKTAQTNNSGNYTVPYLEPGNYTVEVSASGFQTIKREKIVLQVAQTLGLPFSMHVGNASTEVTVSAEPLQVDTQSADRGLVFDPAPVQIQGWVEIG
jgi:hypothetical protein